MGLAEENADDIVFLIETIPCVLEVEVLLEILLLDEPFRKYPVLLSVTGHIEKNNSIASGESVGELCSMIQNILQSQKVLHSDSLLLALGFNCTPPAKILSLLEEVKRHELGLPLMCYPNSGEIWTEEKTWGSLSEFVELPEELRISYSISDGVPLWITSGARIIGGCCRTYPAD